MSIFHIFYSDKSIQKKIIYIKSDIKTFIKPLCREHFWIDSYGAYEIDPKSLVIWICVESDKVKSELESNLDLLNKLKNVLVKYKYPEHARVHVKIGFESQETVDKESNGNWFHHFK